MSIYYRGTTNQEAEIFDSIAKVNYTVKGGAIASLHKPAKEAIGDVIRCIINNNYITYYLQALFLSIIAYVPTRRNLIFVLKRKLSLVLVLISIFGSVALFIVAIDWGRFIYIHLVSLCFLLFISTSPTSNNKEYYHRKITNVEVYNGKKLNIAIIAVFFMIYSLCWRIPHYGTPSLYAQGWRQANAVSFAKPYVKIVLRFFK